tara:strand:- start:429 stop:947 length:519 start_codon:yes stop_codon:yes gene_type:complete
VEEIANIKTQATPTPYKILKMVNGDSVLCKILQESDNAIVVECPMNIVKSTITDKTHHVVEHTGLERWINFTKDISFIIDKEKIMAFGDLAPEILLYYKMVSSRVKAEIEENKDDDMDETQFLQKMEENARRVRDLLGVSDREMEMEELFGELNEEDVEARITHQPTKRILH